MYMYMLEEPFATAFHLGKYAGGSCCYQALTPSFSCLKNSSVKSIIELKNVKVLLGKDFNVCQN